MQDYKTAKEVSKEWNPIEDPVFEYTKRIKSNHAYDFDDTKASDTINTPTSSDLYHVPKHHIVPSYADSYLDDNNKYESEYNERRKMWNKSETARTNQLNENNAKKDVVKVEKAVTTR